MQKERYEEATVELVSFETQDVITTSQDIDVEHEF